MKWVSLWLLWLCEISLIDEGTAATEISVRFYQYKVSLRTGHFANLWLVQCELPLIIIYYLIAVLRVRPFLDKVPFPAFNYLISKLTV